MEASLSNFERVRAKSTGQLGFKANALWRAFGFACVGGWVVRWGPSRQRGDGDGQIPRVSSYQADDDTPLFNREILLSVRIN